MAESTTVLHCFNIIMFACLLDLNNCHFLWGFTFCTDFQLLEVHFLITQHSEKSGCFFFHSIFFHSLIRKVESFVELLSINVVYPSLAQKETKVLRISHCRTIILSRYNLDKTLSKLISTLNSHLCQHFSLVCNVGKSKPFVHWNMLVPSTLAVRLQSQFQAHKGEHHTKEMWINSYEEDTPNRSTHILYSGTVEVSQEAVWKHFSGLGILDHNPSPLAKRGLCRVFPIPL